MAAQQELPPVVAALVEDAPPQENAVQPGMPPVQPGNHEDVAAGADPVAAQVISVYFSVSLFLRFGLLSSF